MGSPNSLVMTSEVIAKMLDDVSILIPEWFPSSAAKKTKNKILSRVRAEGIGFLMKTMPRLGKSTDRALSGEVSLDCLRFRKVPGTQLPIFLGELFQRIFSSDGWVLPNPCVESIRIVRQILYLFYKYELPYDPEDEKKVVDDFVKVDASLPDPKIPDTTDDTLLDEAKRILAELLSGFDPRDITPRHGPGSVATGEKVHEKMGFKRLVQSIDSFYPYDEYYYSSLSHVCDRYDHLQNLQVVPTGTAKVCLVPKDSRGPRLISEEPLEIQWIQQGLGRALVSYVERHPLTRRVVRFTDQTFNRNMARKASLDHECATLDLKEASDRVSLSLVRRLFPEPLLSALEATRSTHTELPDGRIVELRKFAPMGSCLCFPILALTIFALISAMRRRVYDLHLHSASDGFLVFGDDVIVPSAQAADAIETLESAGLLVNRDKSFLIGSFKESCGLDAFNGVEVQPVRVKTVWTSTRSAGALTSWVSYSNSLWSRGYKSTAQHIAAQIIRTYGPIPSRETKIEFNNSVPSFAFEPVVINRLRYRPNADLHRREGYVWVISPTYKRLRSFDGWSELLRFLSTGAEEFTAGTYAIPRMSKLVRRWR